MADDTPGKIAAIFGGPAPLEPVPEVVAELRGLLDRAERGEIRGLAWAVGTFHDEALHGFRYVGGGRFALAAALMALHHVFAADLAEND